jgi:hypothetical protein
VWPHGSCAWSKDPMSGRGSDGRRSGGRRGCEKEGETMGIFTDAKMHMVHIGYYIRKVN